jgi:hypothetical protein
MYVEDAVVHHTLFAYRGEFRWLLFRSFWQGYSKRLMGLLYPAENSEETDYLRSLFFNRVPRRLNKLAGTISFKSVLQILTILIFTSAVGLGYLYAFLTPDIFAEVESAKKNNS